MKYIIILLIISMMFIGCGLKEQEYFFKLNLKELDKYMEKGGTHDKRAIILKKNFFFNRYNSLPLEKKERSDKLGKLSQDLNKYLANLKENTNKEAEVKKELFEKNMKNVFKNFVGVWKAVGMDLVITEDGSVNYKRYKGGWKKEINGKFKEFKGNTFVVSVLFVPVSFRIDQPPHKEGYYWKMKIDGIELTKIL